MRQTGVIIFSKRNNKNKVMKPKKPNKETKKGVKNDCQRNKTHRTKRV